MEDITQIQYVGEQLGIQVELTPKYYTEIAGEGMEYSWVLAKGWYH